MSRGTYEKLKMFCESHNISMSQFVETRVGDFLSTGEAQTAPVAPKAAPTAAKPTPAPARPATAAAPAPAPVKAAPAPVPMTSAAARYAVEPPPPIIKPKAETAAPKPAEKRPDQIFTF
ncbi:MAG: hypothetical protein R2939_07225 [Kofleriaceae bacterium]